MEDDRGRIFSFRPFNQLDTHRGVLENPENPAEGDKHAHSQ
jgi:hypothetical protein